jgi:hypothetical protein
MCPKSFWRVKRSWPTPPWVWSPITTAGWRTPAQHVSVSGILELYGKTLVKAAQVLDALLTAPLPVPDADSRQALVSAMLTSDAALSPEQTQWLAVLRR